MLRWIIIILLLWVPSAAWAGAASATFGSSGPGFAIVELVLIAAFGALCTFIASALGQGNISSMIKMVTVFACIGVVIEAVWKAITAICQAFGVQL